MNLKTRIKRPLLKIQKKLTNIIVNNADDLSIFVQAARHTVSLKGDYLEFGVYEGASFCAAYNALDEA
jgi:hypothetical protein